jgi:hypothetical protein
VLKHSDLMATITLALRQQNWRRSDFY